MLRSTLAQAGYSVSIASDEEEGVKKAVEQQPGLIILDRVLPGINGGAT